MLSTSHEHLHNSELVAARQKWEQRLRDRTTYPVCLQGFGRTGQADMYVNPEKRMQEALEDVSQQVELLRDDHVFRPPSISAALHGVHFVDKIFGANVYELDGEKDNWQADYLTTNVGKLERPDLETNPTWTAAKAFARSYVSSGVTVPVFQLPTIASVLNVGLNLYGQKLLVAMMVEPAAAHHDLDIINGVLLDVHDWYRSNLPFELLHQVACGGRYQPPGCGQLCGCSTQLVSADTYREFAAYHDAAILSRYANGGMIHLCGSHTQHVETWRDMSSLRAVQLNDRAAEDLEIYLQEMPDKVYYVDPCDGMPLEKIRERAKNHRIVICAEPAGVT